MDEKKLKPTKTIFISSPSDTRQERLKAQAVVLKLAREFSHYFKVEPVLWEREPLKATQHFQADLKPHETDIVVVILWSRLGVPLPLDEYPGPITGKQVTGTEYEFEDAFVSYKEKQRPDILLYRKNAEVLGSLEDDAALDQQRQQKRALEDFIRRWFVDGKDNSFKLAFRVFSSTTEFESMLETHLRKLLDNQLDEDKKIDIHWHAGSPFRGLETFELEHASVFFGRTRARNELRELLTRRIKAGSAFVLVFGASGCGKSSLVKSGLLADLKLPGMIGQVALCRHAIFRPSDAPDLLQGLANALLGSDALPELSNLNYDSTTLAEQLHGTSNQATLPIRQALDAAKGKPSEELTDRAEARLVLIIDQLEELFTIDTLTSEQRTSFVSTLETLARSGLVWVIATMRSDFFDRLEQLPKLAQLSFGEARYLLTFPDDVEIKQIIRQPALEAGLEFEYNNELGYDLADELCKAASQAPSSLPLLEFTLDQLWQRRSEKGELTFAAYKTLGGLEGALGCRAEEEFLKLPAEVQAALPQVLRALSNVDQGLGTKVTARSASFETLSESIPVHLLVQAFLDPHSRLLVSGDDKSRRVRVSHEALLTHWKRAQNQLENDRGDLQVRSRLEQAASLWSAADTANQADWLLPIGKPLVEAEDLLKRRRSELDITLITYIDASSKAVQDQLKRKKHRLYSTITGVSILAVIASILAFMFYHQKQEADREREIALSGELAAQAALLAEHASDDSIIERAAALAIESWNLVPNSEASSAANKLLRMLPKYRIQHDETVMRVMSIAFSPDGGLLAIGSKDKTLRLIKTENGKEEFRIEHDDEINSVAFSPDGRFLATGGNKTTQLIGIASRKEVFSLVHDGEVSGVSFSPDSRLLATAGKDHTARLIDVSTGIELRQIIHGDEVWNIAFSPDSRLLATASKDNMARVIDTSTGKERLRVEHGAEVNNVTFSFDGRLLATASKDNTARLIDASTGKELRQIKHRGMVSGVAFSPDGLWLATGSYDKTARVTEISSGREVAQFLHKDGVFAVRFSPDGRLLATSSLDGTARLIETATWQEVARIIHGGAVWNIVFSPNSQQLATVSMDKVVRLIETVKNPDDIKIKHDGAIMGIAFNPKGRFLATASADKTAKLVEITTGKEVMAFKHAGTVYGVSFSWDGRFLATSSKDHTAKLIDATNGNEIASIIHNDEVRSIAFSPDSRWLATGSLDKAAKVIDTATGKEITQIDNNDEIRFVAFSFDGQLLAIASRDGMITIMDAKTWQPRQPIKSSVPVSYLAFSPDGRLLAIASEDKTARLIEIATGGEKAKFEHPEAVLNVAFSPDGKLLATSSMDNTARLFAINTGHLIASIKHGGPVTAVAFSPTGKVLATGSRDNTTRLIETVSGLEIARMSHADEVWAVAFSPDGQLLASGVSDGHVQLHGADPQKLFDLLCTKAGRNLNQDELHDYLGISAPHQTCKDWRASRASVTTP